MFDEHDGARHWSTTWLTNEHGGYTSGFRCGAPDGALSAGDDPKRVTCEVCRAHLRAMSPQPITP